MSNIKFLLILDNGHGGLVDGKYVTPGKRSPVFDDGITQLFEGVYNRDIVKRISDGILAAYPNGEVAVVHVAPEDEDTSMLDRVNRANKAWADHGKCPAVYISIHADAMGMGEKWEPATGISVWTTPGQTESDVFATLLFNKLKSEMGNETKWRTDNTSDGDPDKEAHFYVLRKTNMPAVLTENGFMTNKSEAEKMMTDEWRNKIAQAHFDAIVEYVNEKIK